MFGTQRNLYSTDLGFRVGGNANFKIHVGGNANFSVFRYQYVGSLSQCQGPTGMVLRRSGI